MAVAGFRGFQGVLGYFKSRLIQEDSGGCKALHKGTIIIRSILEFGDFNSVSVSLKGIREFKRIFGVI